MLSYTTTALPNPKYDLLCSPQARSHTCSLRLNTWDPILCLPCPHLCITSLIQDYVEGLVSATVAQHATNKIPLTPKSYDKSALTGPTGAPALNPAQHRVACGYFPPCTRVETSGLVRELREMTGRSVVEVARTVLFRRSVAGNGAPRHES